MQTTQKLLAMLKSGTNVFLTGAAGTGKSYMIHEIKKRFNTVVLAPTGIAATHVGGETLHSFFSFPMEKEAGLRRYNREDREIMREIFQQIELLVVDEISMVHDYLLRWMELRFEEVGVELPVMLFSGDFYQLPPVCRDDDVRFAFEGEFWKKHRFQTLELTQIYRTEHRMFAKVLGELRRGIVTPEAEKLLASLKSQKPSDDYTHLYSTNNRAFVHNRRMLERIKKPIFLYELSEVFTGDERQRYEYDLKKNFLKSRFENKLYLKVGAKVIFTYNDKEKGYYNGQTGTVTRLTNNAIYVDGTEVERVAIDINTYRKVNGKVEKIRIGQVVQYPLKLGYAITIHKSQGMSIDKLHVDIGYIFAPGQAYVALSRARDPRNTSVFMGTKEPHELFYTDSAVDAFYAVLKQG